MAREVEVLCPECFLKGGRARVLEERPTEYVLECTNCGHRGTKRRWFRWCLSKVGWLDE